MAKDKKCGACGHLLESHTAHGCMYYKPSYRQIEGDPTVHVSIDACRCTQRVKAVCDCGNPVCGTVETLTLR